MQITREEVASGGPNRTPRKEINPLNTQGFKVETEVYLDASPSTAWPWDSDPNICTWLVQLEAFRQFLVPFEKLDSEAAAEQSSGSDEKGGVYTYPFSNRFLPIGEGEDDGDLNSSNWERKWRNWFQRYFHGSKLPDPEYGGTVAMSAVRAGDTHYLTEFKGDSQLRVRARTLFTDGLLQDAAEFRSYLEGATLDRNTGYGKHERWYEVWAVAITGPEGSNAGKDAYQQYCELSADHPWIHAYYFEGVTNPAEIAEDMALAVVPTEVQ